MSGSLANRKFPSVSSGFPVIRPEQQVLLKLNERAIDLTLVQNKSGGQACWCEPAIAGRGRNAESSGLPVTHPEREVGKVSSLAMYAFSEIERGSQP
jgi:hypothetical protein